MIICIVHTPPLPPWMDSGNYPMVRNLWSFDLPIFVVNYNVSPQLIKKKLNFSAELVLEPGSPDSETNALPMSYETDVEGSTFDDGNKIL